MVQQAFLINTVCVMCHSLAVCGQELKMQEGEKGTILECAQMRRDCSHCILHAKITCVLSIISTAYESCIFNIFTVKTEQRLYFLEYG